MGRKKIISKLNGTKIELRLTGLHTHLYNTHVEPRLLSKLLSNVPRWLGRGRKRTFKHFKLLGLDGGSRAAALASTAALFVFAIALRVRLFGVVAILLIDVFFIVIIITATRWAGKVQLAVVRFKLDWCLELDLLVQFERIDGDRAGG